MTHLRKDGRRFNELRTIEIVPGAAPYAEGSAAVRFGQTHLLVTASVEKEIPKWMEGPVTPSVAKGWITAEYGMLPRSTHTRNKREAAQGKQSGRTLEIQRLVGRALRSSINLAAIPNLTIKLDCDVICADGGTRTAAISGGWVALRQCLRWCEKNAVVPGPVAIRQVAAISVGVVDSASCLDLCYDEDSSADFDLNVVEDEEGRLIEVQGTAERASLSRESFSGLLELAGSGIRTILDLQRRVTA